MDDPITTRIRNFADGIRAISERSGLSEETVTELLKHGWEWRESINNMPSWTLKGPKTIVSLSKEGPYVRSV